MSERVTEPDESVSYVREMEFYNDAEDVKRVRFIGDSRTVDVGITDDVMVEFLEIAEQVFDEIHVDMAELRDLLHQRGSEDEREGGQL